MESCFCCWRCEGGTAQYFGTVGNKENENDEGEVTKRILQTYIQINYIVV